jgi:hypothetical protein
LARGQASTFSLGFFGEKRKKETNKNLKRKYTKY